MTDFTKSMNKEQGEAVIHEGSPLLILAGAGSGKTRVLTHRIAHLVQNKGFHPASILGVTFTNKAAKEMKERIKALVGKSADFPFLGTFHSICVRILKIDGKFIGLEPTFSIYDDSDQKDIVKEVMKDLNIDTKQLNPSAVNWAISQAKNDMLGPKNYAKLVGDLFTEQVAKIYPEYQKILEERNAVDFDDIILKTNTLFKESEAVRNKYIERFNEVLVDEYQDTNKSQYNLIKTLAKDKQNITVVGDEDQSIYGWRGADIQNILSFEKDFRNPKIIKLEQNYRSTQIILDAAHSVIHKNSERREKKLWSDKKEGPNITIYEAQTEVDEARFIANTVKQTTKVPSNQISDTRSKGSHLKSDNLISDTLSNLNNIAVLYRANAQSRAIEEQLLKAKIPYRLIGGQRFYDRKEIKDALAYLRMFYNPADSLSLLRIINTPARGIGPKTITEIVEISKEIKMPIVDVICSIALCNIYQTEIREISDIRLQTSIKKDDNNLFSTSESSGQQSEVRSLKSEPDPFISALANFSAQLENTKLLNNRPLINLGKIINELREDSLELKLTDFIKLVLEKVGYYKYLNDGTKEGENRADNIKELLSVAAKYDTQDLESGISQFLEDISLIEYAQQKDENDPSKQAVTLMTIHSAKGLEFETVFVVGMEEGIFPHSRSLANNKEMEEERRLAYVAITRAKKNLYMIYAISRNYFGNIQSNLVSRFISDIPENLIEFKNYDENAFTDDYSWDKKEEKVDNNYEYVEYIDVGDRIYHSQFGKGKVTDIENDIITVDFDEKGATKLMSQFARLKKINN
jgi:DNA helicase-2/ATP-dependent DNA helicase PcrA